MISKNDGEQRLDRFIGKAVPLLPASLTQKYIRLKRIKVNGKGSKRDYKLLTGDVVQFYVNDEFFEKPTEKNSYLAVGDPKLDIVYEDENILLVNKKAGTTRSLRIYRPICRRMVHGYPPTKTPLCRRSATV